MKRKIALSARMWMRKLLGLADSPRSIALGATLGVIVAFGPTYGLQIVLAIALAALFRCNKVAAVLSTMLVNPLTGPPIFVAQYFIGRAILGGGSDAEREKARELAHSLAAVRLTALKETLGNALDALGKMGWEVAGPVLLGMAVTSVALGAMTYPLVYKLIVWHRRRRAARRNDPGKDGPKR